MRGRHAPAPRTPAVRARGGRRPPDGRGREPDRQLQGPRHDRGDHQGARGGLAHGHLRLDGQHLGLRRRLCGARGARLRRRDPRGQGGHRQAGPGADARRPRPPDPRELRRGAGARPGPRRARRGDGRELDQPRPARGPGLRGLRARRRPRARAGRRLPPGRQRREHHGVLAGLLRLPGRGSLRVPPAPPRLPGRRCGAHRARPRRRAARDDRDGDPDRQPRQLAGRARRGRRLRGARRVGHRRRDPGGLAAPRDRGVRVLRAGERRGRRGAPPRRRAGRDARRVRPHGQRPEGPRHRDVVAAAATGGGRRPRHTGRRDWCEKCDRGCAPAARMCASHLVCGGAAGPGTTSLERWKVPRATRTWCPPSGATIARGEREDTNDLRFPVGTIPP